MVSARNRHQNPPVVLIGLTITRDAKEDARRANTAAVTAAWFDVMPAGEEYGNATDLGPLMPTKTETFARRAFINGHPSIAAQDV